MNISNKILEYSNAAYDLATYALDTKNITVDQLIAKLEKDSYSYNKAYEQALERYGTDPMDSISGELLIQELQTFAMLELAKETLMLLQEPDFIEFYNAGSSK